MPGTSVEPLTMLPTFRSEVRSRRAFSRSGANASVREVSPPLAPILPSLHKTSDLFSLQDYQFSLPAPVMQTVAYTSFGNRSRERPAVSIGWTQWTSPNLGLLGSRVSMGGRESDSARQNFLHVPSS